MKQYLDLLQHVLENGTRKHNRTGVDTLSTFAVEFKHDLNNGFPILTSKEINFKNIIFEMLFFLGGGSKFLEKHNIKFWNPWRDENGNLPWSYENAWRNYQGEFDQFKVLINELKNNQNSRRLVLDRWYPPINWNESLPPCFFASVFNIQYDKVGLPSLCLHNFARSVDSGVGFPYNLTGFALLQHLISNLINIPVGKIAFSMTDFHLYLNQMNAVKTQFKREPRQLPVLIVSNRIKTLEDVDCLIKDGSTKEISDCFKLENYNPHPPIKLPVAV